MRFGSGTGSCLHIAGMIRQGARRFAAGRVCWVVSVDMCVLVFVLVRVACVRACVCMPALLPRRYLRPLQHQRSPCRPLPATGSLRTTAICRDGTCAIPTRSTCQPLIPARLDVWNPWCHGEWFLNLAALHNTARLMHQGKFRARTSVQV
jgi:hypothetical protein